MTFICFLLLSFPVCGVMFPSSVFLVYAEVMKLGMISRILPEGAATSFPH